MSTETYLADKFASLIRKDRRFAKKDASQRTKVPSIGVKIQAVDESHKNPFILPKDRTWVSLWKEEKKKIKGQRTEERTKKCHEKHTFNSRIAYSLLPRLRKEIKDLDGKISKCVKQEKDLFGGKCKLRPFEREYTIDFIQKKREIFLMEFALQTKRDQVENYKTEAIEQEKYFTKKLKQLHREAMQFDEFLKATDDAAAESMKKAENETKLRIETANEFRRLFATAMTIRSDISRQDEILAGYIKCKLFLNRVYETSVQSPSLSAKLYQDKELKRKAAEKAKKKRKQSKKGLQRKNSVNKTPDKPKIKLPITSGSFHDSPSKILYPEEWQDNDEPAQLPFKSPQELQEIIRDLEERNLKLIIKFQNTEEEFEDMKKYSFKANQYLVLQTEELEDHVNDLRRRIERHEEQADQLKLICAIFTEGSKERDTKKALVELNVKVEQVYKSVFEQPVLTIEALSMLTMLESKLDDLVAEVESFPPEAVLDVQRALDKERRRQVRDEKLTQQKSKQEERAKRVAERHNSLNMRRNGRKLMYRSAPPEARRIIFRKISMRDRGSDIADEAFFQD